MTLLLALLLLAPGTAAVRGPSAAEAVLTDAFGAKEDLCLEPELTEAEQPSPRARLDWFAAVKGEHLGGATLRDLHTAYRRARATVSPDLRKIMPTARFSTEGASCKLRVSLSVPRIYGNWAFVERGATCGPLCGAGFMLAYRLEKGRWRQVATAPSWIS